MAGPKFITPAPIPDLAPSSPSNFWTPYENDRPLNIIGYPDEYDEYENIVLTREEARKRTAEYHARGMRAREIAKSFKDFERVGRVIQHDSNDYVSFRYTATTPRTFDGAPFDPLEFDFDKIIWQDSKIDALGNPRNVSSYDGYAAMRMNIAVLRNIIYNQYFPDGKYDKDDPQDKENYRKLMEMAHFLGDAIRSGVFVKTITGSEGLAGAVAVPVNEANKPDYGAKAMYQFLLERQGTHLSLPVNGIFSTPAYSWDLAPVQNTALSDEALTSFFNATEDLHDVMERLHDHLAGHAETMKDSAIRAANALSRPQDLPQETQAIAVREARNILEKFKGIFDAAERGKDGKNLGNNAVNHEVFLPMEASTLAKFSNQLGQIYLRNLSVLMREGPMDPDLQQVHAQTVQALGALSFAVRNQALGALTRDLNDPLRQEKLQYLTGDFARDGNRNPLPEAWQDVRNHPPHAMLRMIEQVEQGIEEVGARLRMRVQQQDSSGLNRGEEKVQNAMNFGNQGGTPGMQLPAHLLQSTIFSDATARIRQQANAGAMLEKEFSQRQSENGKTQSPSQQVDKDPITPGIQSAPVGHAPQQPSHDAHQQPQQQRPQASQPQSDPQRNAARQQRQQQQVQKEVQRQVRAAQQNPNAKPPKASVFNSFSNKVNQLLSKQPKRLIVTAQNPKMGPTAETHVAEQQTTQPRSATTPRTSMPEQQNITPPVFDPTAPGTYLPPKAPGKNRGI